MPTCVQVPVCPAHHHIAHVSGTTVRVSLAPTITYNRISRRTSSESMFGTRETRLLLALCAALYPDFAPASHNTSVVPVSSSLAHASHAQCRRSNLDSRSIANTLAPRSPSTRRRHSYGNWNLGGVEVEIGLCALGRGDGGLPGSGDNGGDVCWWCCTPAGTLPCVIVPARQKLVCSGHQVAEEDQINSMQHQILAPILVLTMTRTPLCQRQSLSRAVPVAGGCERVRCIVRASQLH